MFTKTLLKKYLKGITTIVIQYPKSNNERFLANVVNRSPIHSTRK